MKRDFLPCDTCGCDVDENYGGKFDGVHFCAPCYEHLLQCQAEAAAEMAAEAAVREVA
jgi:hypothetical protein